MQRPLWREEGSVVCNCCWFSPAQSFSDPSPKGLIPHDAFYCLRFKTPPIWRPGPRIYIPQEQDDSVISPDTGFHFRRLLRLAGLRWRCSTSPPHGIWICLPCTADCIVWRYPWKMCVACSYPRKPLLDVRLHGNLCTELVSRNPPPWKSVLISQQPSGFQELTASFFRTHGQVCLIHSEGLCPRIVSPLKRVSQFVS
jgi:hypothetical protein